jgi:hypothetical protein
MIRQTSSAPAWAIQLALLLAIAPVLEAQHAAMQQGSAADNVLASARRAATAISDTVAARTAGYVPIEELGLPDRNPFQGQHWYNAAHADTLADVALGTPSFVMFAPVKGKLQRIAVAYSAQLAIDAAMPSALGKDSSAMWHVHVLCRLQTSGGRTIVDQVRDTTVCRARGGAPVPRKTAMIHVWTDIANPEGIYGHDNPALPYIATGLTPPGMADLHDSVRSRPARALALALGETYGARLESAYFIEQANKDSALADSLRAHRAAISSLVPELRKADAARDRDAYDRAAARARTEEEAVIHVYEQMAATPRARQGVRRQYEAALVRSMMM